jgi:hypothetical protein
MKYPGVILFERIELRPWLALITLTWAAGAAAMSLIQGTGTFSMLRFIGAAEAALLHRDNLDSFAAPTFLLSSTLLLGECLALIAREIPR